MMGEEVKKEGKRGQIGTIFGGLFKAPQAIFRYFFYSFDSASAA